MKRNIYLELLERPDLHDKGKRNIKLNPVFK